MESRDLRLTQRSCNRSSAFSPTLDHGTDQFRWDMLVLCGDPGQPEQKASFHPDTSGNGWFATPDNIAFDPKGRLWIGTDGMNSLDMADGIYAMDLDGPARGLPKALFFAPFGAECTGPCFTPDGKTLFVAVQHPGEDSENVEHLTTRWPDFDDNLPPRPSVVVITHDEGSEIGT